LRGQRLLVRDELLLLVVELLHLAVELLELLLEPGLPLERLPCQILTVRSEGLPRLGFELDDVLLELRRLELQPFLRRDDVGDPALDVLQRLELLLVGVVERLARVLRAVQERRELRPDDHHRPGHQSRHSVPPRRRCPGSVSVCSSRGACTPTGSPTPTSSRTRRAGAPSTSIPARRSGRCGRRSSGGGWSRRSSSGRTRITTTSRTRASSGCPCAPTPSRPEACEWSRFPRPATPTTWSRSSSTGRRSSRVSRCSRTPSEAGASSRFAVRSWTCCWRCRTSCACCRGTPTRRRSHASGRRTGSCACGG